MFEVVEDYKEMHSNAVKTFEYLIKNCDSFKFNNFPIDELSTGFEIESPTGNRIFIEHSIATGGDLETIHVENNKKKYSTLEYHNSREDLLLYLQKI